MSETTSLPYMGSSLLTVTKSNASGMMTVAFGAGGSISFSPLQLSGIIGWYDASQIAGISSGASLSAWTDLSGQGHHLRQTSVASQPIFVANAKNNLSVVSSTGTPAGFSFSFMTTGFAQTQPTTIILTFSFDSTVASQQDICDGINIASTVLGTITNTHFQAFPGTTTLDSLFTLSVGSWYAGGAIFNGSNSTVFIGSNISTGGAGAGAPVGLSLFGRSNNLQLANIKIGECVYYGRALSAAELSQVTTYLKTKWGTDV